MDVLNTCSLYTVTKVYVDCGKSCYVKVDHSQSPGGTIGQQKPLPYKGPLQGWTFSFPKSSHTSVSLWQPDRQKQKNIMTKSMLQCFQVHTNPRIGFCRHRVHSISLPWGLTDNVLVFRGTSGYMCLQKPFF